MQTVICIRWGDEYGADYVNRLYRAVMRNVERPTRFVAFTDPVEGLDAGIEAKPIPPIRLPAGLKPGPWRKLALWAPDLGGLETDVLFLDLDILVTGPLDPLFDHEPGQLVLVRNPTQGRRDGIGNSSVMRFRAGSAPHLVSTFEADAVRLSYRFDNEQIYVTKEARPARRVLAGGVVPELQTRAAAALAVLSVSAAAPPARGEDRRLHRPPQARRSHSRRLAGQMVQEVLPVDPADPLGGGALAMTPPALADDPQ